VVDAFFAADGLGDPIRLRQLDLAVLAASST